MRRRMALATAAVTLFSPLFLAGTAQAATTNVALWSMESVTNRVMSDSSAYGNNGTTTSVTTVADPGFGSGYHFGLNTSAVTVPNSTSLTPGTADFSVSMRVRFDNPPDAATGDFDLIRKGLATTQGGEWKIEIFPNTQYSSPAFCLFNDADGTTVRLRGNKNLADGAWHTITCAKTSTYITLTVDGGTLKALTPSGTTLGSIDNTDVVGLGQKPGGGDQYIGDMDEVRIDVGSSSAGDTTSPTATVAPADGATGVGGSANVTATFSEAVQGVDLTTFTLTDSSGLVVPGTVTNPTGNKWVLNPTGTLAPGTVYTATLVGGGGPTGIRDLANNPLSPNPKTWRFTTA